MLSPTSGPKSQTSHHTTAEHRVVQSECLTSFIRGSARFRKTKPPYTGTNGADHSVMTVSSAESSSNCCVRLTEQMLELWSNTRGGNKNLHSAQTHPATQLKYSGSSCLPLTQLRSLNVNKYVEASSQLVAAVELN